MKVNEKRALMIIAVVFAIAIGAVAGFIFRTADCGRDENCFNDLGNECKRAKVDIIREGIQYEYKVKGINFFTKECQLDVAVKKVVSSNPDFIRSFSGAEMSCSMPRENTIDLTKNEQILRFCHGTLKEALYELTINRLYSLVVGDLGKVIAKANI